MTETQTLETNWTECYAVPGVGHIIDAINPITGLTFVNGSTEADILAREPQAVRMTWDAYATARSKQQRTPITWDPTTAEKYEEMLCVLPPAYWRHGAFLVGEPSDHDVLTGQPRFAAFVAFNDVFLTASRPLTIAELKAELGHDR